MPSPEDHLGYLCFRKRADGEAGPAVIAFGLFNTLDEVDGWIAKDASASKEAEDTAKEESEGQAEKTPVREVTTAIKRFVKAMLAFHPLIQFTSVLPPLVEAGMVQARILPFAETDCALVRDAGGFSVFAFTQANTGRLYELTRELEDLRMGYSVLPGSVVLSLVATFDSHFSDFIASMLRSAPGRYKGSDRTLSVREILGMTSFEDVIDSVIEDEVYDLMRGTHAEQVRFVETQFNISIREHYERWPAFVEIFERRNLVAHGNCTVNARYLKNCRLAGLDVTDLAVGEELALEPKYLRTSTDVLTEFGILLMLAVFRKQSTAFDEELLSEFNQITYDLIKSRRSKLAVRLLEFALEKQTVKVSDSLRKMLVVNFANALRKTGDHDRSKKVLDTTDWSATTDNYKICVASLRDDVDGFVALMSKVVQADSVSMIAFREWPVFDWVRADDRVKDEFKRLFGENLAVAEGGIEDQREVTAAQPTSTPLENKTLN